MSLAAVPLRVRINLALFWVGIVVAGLGIVGFFLSFGQVASSTQAAIDVHEDIPVFAYAAIAGWIVGLFLMWYSRRNLDAAVSDRVRERREAVLADLDPRPGEDEPTNAPDGRDA